MIYFFIQHFRKDILGNTPRLSEKTPVEAPDRPFPDFFLRQQNLPEARSTHACSSSLSPVTGISVIFRNRIRGQGIARRYLMHRTAYFVLIQPAEDMPPLKSIKLHSDRRHGLLFCFDLKKPLFPKALPTLSSILFSSVTRFSGAEKKR